PLGAALHGLLMSGTFYCRSELSAPWGTTLPVLPDCVMFHAVVAGQCWLAVDGAAPMLLQPGHFALVPHGQGHRLMSEPGVATPPLFDLPCEMLSERYEVRRHDGGGAPTLLLCGAMHFDRPAARRMVSLLPSQIVVQTAEMGGAGRWQAVLQWMGEEARALHPGGEAVLTRLADVLVIQAIRHWMQRDPAARTGWLGALQDPRIGRALAAVHRDPARAWTLAALAGEAAMSRSAFASRFLRLLGVPPMHYLAQWRMELANARLHEGGVSIAALAAELGYQSEAAFNRAFKRHTGTTPGAVARAGAIGRAA
ncbi:AraC family transcriptional regulator, partial [Piscinibacter sp.]|uniref:AraC family transcriptional regulator n=1 Tax=Piscinibacter sp. TaxID=1903157 RepID=UPI002CB4B0C1